MNLVVSSAAAGLSTHECLLNERAYGERMGDDPVNNTTPGAYRFTLIS